MITQEELKKLLEYKDGKFYSKVNRTRLRIGEEAGGRCPSTGYYRVKIHNKLYKRARLVFLYHKGYFPLIVDHINGDITDDRIENIREADANTNQYNAKLRKDSTSKVKGVTWSKSHNKWQVRLGVNGKRKSIGYYEDFELASLVSEEARNKYHKEFVRHE